MRVIMLIVMVLMILIMPGPAAAQGEGEVPGFDQFLQYLSGPWIALAVCVILSWVVEYIPAYNKLEPRWSRLVYFGLCLILPVGAALLRWALGYVALTFDPLLWHAIWNGAAAGGIGTLAHTRKLPTAEEIAERRAYMASLEAEAERASRRRDTS